MSEEVRCANCHKRMGSFDTTNVDLDRITCSWDCMCENEQRRARARSYVSERARAITVIETADAFLRTLLEIRALPTTS
jgi:hypothetical protein